MGVLQEIAELAESGQKQRRKYCRLLRGRILSDAFTWVGSGRSSGLPPLSLSTTFTWWFRVTPQAVPLFPSVKSVFIGVHLWLEMSFVVVAVFFRVFRGSNGRRH
jgi:hypothetical protein